MKYSKFILSFIMIMAVGFAMLHGAESISTAAIASIPVMAFPEWLEKEHNITSEKLAEEGADKLAEKYNEYNSIWRKAIADSISEKIGKADIAKLRNDFTEELKNQMGEINKTLEVTTKAISVQLKQGAPAEKALTFKESLAENLNNTSDTLAKMKSENTKDNVSFTVKAVGNMTSANISGGNVPVEDRLAGLDLVASRKVRLLDIINRRTTMSNLVSWVSQSGKEGSAGQTGEGLAKNQIDFDLVVDSESLKKTTAFIKVSTEMLDDIVWLQSEIEGELMREVLKALELTVYSGDDTGNNHNGVITVAEAWSDSPFTDLVENANAVDVATVALNQIRINEHDLDRPYIMMNPSDVTTLRMTKVSATDTRYNMRLVDVAGNLSLDGHPILETTLVTANTMVVGDFAKVDVFMNNDIKIDIGLDADDFTKNMRTVLAEVRALTLVRTNERDALIYVASITAAAALLEKP